MKHFETLWVEAERASLNDSTLDNCVDNLIKHISSWKGASKEKIIETMGDVLFDICSVSARINVNTYAALHQKIQDEKVRVLEPEDDDS